MNSFRIVGQDVWLCVLIGLAWGCGNSAGFRPAKFLSTNHRSGLSACGTSFLLAQATFGLGVLALALLGLVIMPVVCALLIGMVATGLPYARLNAVRTVGEFSELGAHRWIIFVSLVPAALSVLVPEFEVDALMYHLGAPWQIVQTHRTLIDHVPMTFHLSLPIEMSFTIPLWLGDERLAKGIIFLSVLSALAIFAGVHIRKGEFVAVWAGVPLSMATGWILWLASRSKNDAAAAACFVAGALHILSGSRRIGCVLMGFCVSEKNVYGPLVATFFAFQPNLWSSIPSVMISTVLLMFPWCAKSYFSMGNPFFPVGGSIFPSPAWTEASQQAFRAYSRGLWTPGTEGWGSIPTAWVTILLRDDPFTLMVIIGLATFGRFRPVALSLIAGQLVTLGATHTHRFLAPSLWMSSLLAAGQLSRLPMRSSQMCGYGLVVYSLIRVGFMASLPWRVHSDSLLQSRAVARATVLTSFDEASRVLSALRPRRTITIGELRTYPLSGRVIYGGTIGETPLIWTLIHDSQSTDDVSKRLRQVGAQTLLYNYVNGTFVAQYYRSFAWDLRMLKLYSHFARSCLRERFSTMSQDFQNGGFTIYEILPAPRIPPATSVQFLPGTEVTYLPSIELRNTGRLDDAIQAIHDLSSQFPEIRFYATETATNLSIKQDWPAVYRTLKPLVAQGWKDPRILSTFGASAVYLGKFKEAYPALKEALKRSMADQCALRLLLARVSFTLAQASGDRHDWAREEHLLLESTNILNTSPVAWSKEEAAERRKGDALVHGLLGDLSFNRGRNVDAVRFYQKAVEIEPTHQAAEYWRGRILTLSTGH